MSFTAQKCPGFSFDVHTLLLQVSSHYIKKARLSASFLIQMYLSGDVKEARNVVLRFINRSASFIFLITINPKFHNYRIHLTVLQWIPGTILNINYRKRKQLRHKREINPRKRLYFVFFIYRKWNSPIIHEQSFNIYPNHIS